MTPEAIFTEFLSREKAANAPGGHGADPAKIIPAMMRDYNLTRQQIVQAVLDHTNNMGG